MFKLKILVYMTTYVAKKCIQNTIITQV